MGESGLQYVQVVESGEKWYKMEQKWQPILKEGVSSMTGEYNHSIDAKGRLIIPSKLRESLGEDFKVTKGFDNVLYIYPQEEWKHLEDKLKALSLNNPKGRQLTRFFAGSAIDGALDKQGRVLIPAALRQHASLDKEVVLVGMLDRVEVWDKARWDANNAAIEEDIDAIASDLDDLGICI